jgi:histidine triad (HIT) family protein
MELNMPVYDHNNVFAQILAGKLPCYKICEDEKTFVFLDIMPRADGHALVIPKAPVRNIFDCPPELLSILIMKAQLIAKAAKYAFSADGVTLMQYNEAAGGQEVFHLHFHVIPRKAGQSLRPPGQMADKALLAKHAEILRISLSV